MDRLALLLAEQDITRLVYEYSATIDDGRLKDMAALFARGTWHVGGQDYTGSEAVLRHLSKTVILHDGTPRTRHVVTNLRIDVDSGLTRATARSYVTLTQCLPDSAPALLVQGRYEDVFARDDKGWYFVLRRALVDGYGDASAHIRR